MPEGAVGLADAPVEVQSRDAPDGSLRSGTLWGTVSQVVQLGGLLGLTPFVIAHLGLERYGLYVLVLTIVNVLQSFDGGLSASAGRYFAVYVGRRDDAACSRLMATVVLMLVGAGSCVVMAVTLLAPAVVDAFGVVPGNRAQGVFLLQVLGVVGLLTVLRSLMTALVAAHRRYAAASCVTIASNLGFYLGLYLVLRGGGGLFAIGWLLLGQASLTLAVLVALAWRHLVPGQLLLMPTADLREFLRFAWRVQLVGVSSLIAMQTDALIVGGAISVAEVGVYSVGANASTQLRLVPQNGLGPTMNILGAAYADRGTGAVDTFRGVQRTWMLFVTAWCSVGIGALGFGIASWLGPRAHLAPVVAVVLLAGNMVNLWTGPLTCWLATTGNVGLEVRYSTVSTVLNLVLTVVLVVPFGLVGVAVATSTGQVVGSLYLLRLVRLRVDHAVPSYLREVPWLPMLATAAAVVALELPVHPYLPEGAAGFLLAGVVAAPGFAVFALLGLGPAATAALLRRVRARVLR